VGHLLPFLASHNKNNNLLKELFLPKADMASLLRTYRVPVVCGLFTNMRTNDMQQVFKCFGCHSEVLEKPLLI
jgi:hypothetical protein